MLLAGCSVDVVRPEVVAVVEAETVAALAPLVLLLNIAEMHVGLVPLRELLLLTDAAYAVQLLLLELLRKLRKALFLAFEAR